LKLEIRACEDQEISWNKCKILVILNKHEDKACEIEIRALDTAKDQEISWNDCKTFEKIQKHDGIKSSIRMSFEPNLRIIQNSKSLQNLIIIIKQKFEVYDEVREAFKILNYKVM